MWFADLLDIIKNDPVARRIPYITTWYNKPNQFWVPYADTIPGYEAFLRFHRDGYMAFGEETGRLGLYAPPAPRLIKK